MFAGGFNDLIHNFIAGVPLIFCKLLINWLKKENLLSSLKKFYARVYSAFLYVQYPT